MHAVDTNVLVRLLTGDDRRQAAQAEAFVRTAGHVWISHVVLVETIWVMESVYDKTRDEVAAAVGSLLDHQQFALQGPDVVRAALALFRSKRSVGFSDCMVLEIARQAGHVPLGTFDRQLASADGAVRIGA
jgi:predicted nucleic-acid-binding protein